MICSASCILACGEALLLVSEAKEERMRCLMGDGWERMEGLDKALLVLDGCGEGRGSSRRRRR